MMAKTDLGYIKIEIKLPKPFDVHTTTQAALLPEDHSCYRTLVETALGVLERAINTRLTYQGKHYLDFDLSRTDVSVADFDGADAELRRQLVEELRSRLEVEETR